MTALLKRIVAFLRDRFAVLINGTYPAQPVALFRITGALVALADLIATKRIALLIWDPGPAQPVVSIAYWAWAATLVALVLGYKTTHAAWLNYLFTFPMLQSIRPFLEYHIDYYLHTWAFFLLLLRSGTAFSVDAWLLNAKQLAAGLPRLPAVVPRWPVTLFMIQFALDYFDAGLSKLYDFEMWRAGFGLYWPLVVRYGSSGMARWVIEYGPLIVSLGAFSFYWEISFPFLMLWKPLRVVALIFGVFFHIGIVILLPIHYFGELMIALYTLLIPWDFVQRAASRIRKPRPARVVRIVPGCEGCARHAALAQSFFRHVVIESGDVHLRTRLGPHERQDSGASAPAKTLEERFPWLPTYAVVGMVVFLLIAKLGHQKITPEPFRTVTNRLSKQLSGFVIHTVFMAHHFRNQRIPVAELQLADGRLRHFPLIRKDGFPDTLVMGSTRLWVFLLRMGQSQTPEKFGDVLADWVDRTEPAACGFRLTFRHVLPPSSYVGDVDVWTTAPVVRVLNYSFNDRGCPILPNARKLEAPPQLQLQPN